MKENNQSSLYYVIPAEIMHSKELSMEEKLLYGLISGLSNKHGYCFASNEWFQEELNISESSLKKYLHNLEKSGYITRKMTSLENNPFKKQRHIFINTNFKKCLPRSEFNLIEKPESNLLEGQNLTPIISEEKKLKSEEKKSAAPPPSADASALFNFFLQKIKERNPAFKDPNREKWAKEFEAMMKHDKRKFEDVKDLIEWIHANSFWKSICLSPSSLRKNYDKIAMQREGEKEKRRIDDNKEFVFKLKKKYPERLKSLSISSKYAMNLAAGKELPFDLPQETFTNAFCQMFGGYYEPDRSDRGQNKLESDGSEQ